LPVDDEPESGTHGPDWSEVSAEHDAVNAETPQEPIGTLLVKRGMITDVQLTEALEEQRASGEQLGTILVARGYAPAALVAQALATQHGSMLKTEYGFATGFGSEALAQVATAEPPVSVHLARASTAVAAPPASHEPRESDREAVRAELELASSESTRLTEANERLSVLRAELEQRLAHEAQRSASLERELAELRSGPAPVADDLAAWQQSNAQLDAALAQWQAAYAELEQRLAQSKAHAEKREGELRGLESSARELSESLSSLDEARVAADDRAATAEGRHAKLERELEQATARADASAERAAVAEEARNALEHQIAEISTRTEALQVQLVAAAKSHGSLAASEKARADLEARLQQAVERLREAAEARIELESRLEVMTARAASAEMAATQADQLRAAVAAAEHETAVLEQRLTTMRVELEQREAERVELEVAVEPDTWACADSHLVFFQGSEGYELAELDGPPPAEGTQIELPGLPLQTVARVGRSPFRGDSIPCAYLVAT
jgi:chromosome segregation ATPase